MILTLTTTHSPATDLGYLLHKHPDRLQHFDLPFGKVHVFYPEANKERATAALLLDIDPIRLVRKEGNEGFSLSQYVNDRPYVASSFMSVAISRTLGTALNGRCDKRPELPERVLPLKATVAVVSAAGGGEALIRRLFEPLGYELTLERHPLDEAHPAWGDSRYYTLHLRGELTVQALLSHLYVLLPVLDRDKHYYVGEKEVEKLLRHGEGWLADHPAREEITRRYLKFRSLTRTAIDQLEAEAKAEAPHDEVEARERRQSLHQLRLEAVYEQLVASGVSSVVDLGCGEGRLLQLLMKNGQFTRISGTDVSINQLQRAGQRLHYDRMSPGERKRITLFQSALTYRDDRLAGYDAAALVEVIEHLDEDRLDALERVVFRYARPGRVLVTTPNAEYNVRYDFLEEGQLRHADHRFEWTRRQFSDWCTHVADTFNYTFTITPLGPADDEVGAPSQLAEFIHAT